MSIDPLLSICNNLEKKTKEMGILAKLVDSILIGFFLVIAIAAPALDAQTCISESVFPGQLVDLKRWYAREYGDYLVAEKPHFFFGLVWLELLFQWPLSIVNIYGIITAKSWLNTTCLIYGVSAFTSMVAILSEMIGSGRAPAKLLYMYFPFLVFAALAMLRGLLPQPCKSVSSKGAAVSRKKRA